MALTHGDAERHLQKLAALATQRRVALGFVSKEAAADACGISHTTYRKIEFGQPVRATTYAKLEMGFGFRAGSVKALLDGESDSITLNDGTELIEGGAIRDFGTLEDEVARAFDKSAQLTNPDLTYGQARAMKDEMIRELRERGIIKSK